MKTLSKSLLQAALASAILLSSATFAADIDQSADANDVAIKGYDPVSYFTASEPQQGSDTYTATYKNAIYKFTSAENRDAFRANPTKYAPQFGGFCALGTAMGKKFETDPLAWKIVDHKLYLNLNSDIQSRWLGDIPGYIKEANSTWVDIQHKTPEELE